MKMKVVQDADVVTYVAVCDPGDEAVAALKQFTRAERLEASQVTAVGAFERATVGWFDRAAKQYRRIPVDEQCEVLSLIGDVAEGPDGPSLHAHVVLGLADGTTRGGHLLEGWVFPTPGSAAEGTRQLSLGHTGTALDATALCFRVELSVCRAAGAAMRSQAAPARRRYVLD